MISCISFISFSGSISSSIIIIIISSSSSSISCTAIIISSSSSSSSTSTIRRARRESGPLGHRVRARAPGGKHLVNVKKKTVNLP